MQYLRQLTFLRFLAAILVVVFHFGRETFPFTADSILPFIEQGSIAVSFFFFLSGVVLALNYMEKSDFSVREFFIKRLARLYPLYILAFGATLILGMVFNDAFPKGGSILLQLFSLHAWLPGICLEINYPSWSISVEVFFYLLFPLILKFMKRMGNTKTTVFIVAFWLLSGLQHYLFSNYVYDPSSAAIGQFILYFPLWHLNTFLTGILCAKYILKKREATQPNLVQARIFYTLGTLVFFLILSTNNGIKPYTHNGLMAPVFFLIIAGLAIDRSILSKFLGNKIFVLLGNASFGIYLLQWPVYICMGAILGMEQLSGMYFYLYVLSLVLFSVIVYIAYEEKMKRFMLKKWMHSKQEKP